MTRILIVEDDQAQCRVLARAIARRRPDYTVLTSENGARATAVLREQEVDLVLTDLQMPEMNGFELLTWMFEHRPSVLVFAMTAYGSEESRARIAALGSIECFTKPIDIAAVLNRVSESLAQSICGQVQNVSLASFLQLIEMEKKTCVLTVRSGDQEGRLFLRGGELLDARIGERGGEEAAVEIIGWPNVRIVIENSCSVRDRSILKPMGYLVMDAMRIHDETERDSINDAEDRSAPLASWYPPTEGGRSEKPSWRVSAPPLRQPPNPRVAPGILSFALVDTTSGVILAYDSSDDPHLPEEAATAAAILRQKLKLLARAPHHESVEELVLNTARRCDLIRPLAGGNCFALLAFDPSETTLVMARLEIEELTLQYAPRGSLG